MEVVKRDGRKEEFDEKQIRKAILSAARTINTEIEDIESLLEKIITKLPAKQEISVTEIEKIVEHSLMISRYKDVARSYIEYRSYRDKVRESNGKLFTDISGFLAQTAEEFTRENANKSSSIVNTHRDLLAGIVSKHCAFNHIYPKYIADWHKQGFGHCHDADYIISPLTNCSLVNYRDMLENGFKIGNAKIEKPKSIGVATTVLTQIIQAVASSQYGK